MMIGFLSQISWRYWLAFAVAASLATYHWQAVRRAYDRGYAAAITKIQEANRDAERKARAGEAAVDKCYRDGGEWLRDEGKCRSPVRRDN